MLFVPPSRSKRDSSMTRRSFAWVSRDMSPISSRKSVPPSASSNLPRLALHRAGEGAALVPEELGEEQALAEGRAVDGDERAVPARAREVDVAGKHLLAGPALPGDEHRDGRVLHLVRGGEQGAHGRVVRDELVGQGAAARARRGGTGSPSRARAAARFLRTASRSRALSMGLRK